MPNRHASAVWRGTLTDGTGTMRLGSGAYEGEYSFKSRFESGEGTNPEELLGAAHAGCFSMALSKVLTDAGHPPSSIETTADVHLERMNGAFSITRIDLHTVGDVPGLDAAGYRRHAETAKLNCPVSKALSGTYITVDAKLA